MEGEPDENEEEKEVEEEKKEIGEEEEKEKEEKQKEGPVLPGRSRVSRFPKNICSSHRIPPPQV